MEEVKYYRVGIELLDENQRPTEHERCSLEFDIEDALNLYHSVYIEKNKSAKYLIAVSFTKEEMLLLSDGYKEVQ